MQRFPRLASQLCGLFWMCSGAFAQTIGGEWQQLGPVIPTANDTVGAMMGLEDLNGDGHRDVAVVRVNFPVPGLGFSRVVVDIVSGIDAQLIRRIWLADGWQMGALGAVDRLDDLDGDGIREFALVAENALVAPDGAIVIVSLGAGAVLRLTLPSLVGERFRYSVASVGDLDGDGVEEYAAGSLGPVSSVSIYSGSGGHLLRRIPGTLGTEFGRSLDAPGDLDGDGVTDMTVGAPKTPQWYPGIGFSHGSVHAYSGATGTELWHARPWAPIPGSSFPASFGEAQDATGDVNSDGIGDLLVGAWGDGAWPYQGSVYLVSGADGRSIWRVLGSSPNAGLGKTVAFVGDIDGDGDSDVAAGGPWHSPTMLPGAQYGEVQVLDAATGNLLHQAVGEESESDFGLLVVGLGDLDGDGNGEIGITAGGGANAPQQKGVHHLSFDPYIQLGASPVSVSAAGEIPMRLDFPNTEAGKRYVVLASVPPTPNSVASTPLAGIAVPLVQSQLLFRTSTGSAPHGTLDTHGDAIVRVRIPANAGFLVGRTLHFAAVSIDPQSGAGGLASAPRAVSFVP